MSGCYNTSDLDRHPRGYAWPADPDPIEVWHRIGLPFDELLEKE